MCPTIRSQTWPSYFLSQWISQQQRYTTPYYVALEQRLHLLTLLEQRYYRTSFSNADHLLRFVTYWNNHQTAGIQLSQ